MKTVRKILTLAILLWIALIPSTTQATLYTLQGLTVQCAQYLAEQSVECLKNNITGNNASTSIREWAPSEGSVYISEDRKRVEVDIVFDKQAINVFTAEPNRIMLNPFEIYPMNLGLEVELIGDRKVTVKAVKYNDDSHKMRPYRDTEFGDDLTQSGNEFRTLAQLIWADMNQAKEGETYRVVFEFDDPLPMGMKLKVHFQLSADLHIDSGLNPPFEYFGVETDFHDDFTVEEIHDPGFPDFCWKSKNSMQNDCAYCTLPPPVESGSSSEMNTAPVPSGSSSNQDGDSGAVISKLNLTPEVLIKNGDDILETSTKLTVGKTYKISAKAHAWGADAEEWMKDGKETVEADLCTKVGGNTIRLKRFHLEAKDLRDGHWASDYIDYEIPDVGSLAFWVVVNETEDAVENNYDDNESPHKTFRTRVRKSNHKITWVGIEGGDTSVKKDKSIQPVIKVENNGDGDTRNETRVALYYKGPDTGNKWVRYDRETVKASKLDANEEERVEMKKIKFKKTGTYQFLAKADCDEVEPEEDERDNETLSSPFKVK